MQIIVAELLLSPFGLLKKAEWSQIGSLRHAIPRHTSTRIRMSLNPASRTSPLLIASLRVPFTTRKRISSSPVSFSDTVKTCWRRNFVSIGRVSVLGTRSHHTLLKIRLACGRANLTNATPVMLDTSSMDTKDSSITTQLAHVLSG